MESKEKEVLIIGGGIAGLSAGIYAQKNGYKATIVEQHPNKPGGQLTSWSRGGDYTFDYCLEWLVGTRHGVYNGIWHEIGALDGSVGVVDHDVFVKLVDEGGEHGEFYLYSDMDRWETYLKSEVALEDSKAIGKLCRLIKKSVEFEDLESPPGMRSWWDYLRWIFKSWKFLPILTKYGKMTAKGLIDDVGFKNENLRYFLTRVATVNPYKDEDLTALGLILMLGFQHDRNAGYLEGGSGQMVQRIRDTYEKLGGKFKFNSKVVEIVVEDKEVGADIAAVVRGVKLDNGEQILADHVISACDGHSVLWDMLDGDKYLVPAKYKKPYEEWSVFTPMVMVGVGIEDIIESSVHSIVYCNSKEKKIQIGRTAAYGYRITNRCSYDDTLTSKGKTVLEIEFSSPWEIWEDLSDAEYAKEKEDIKNKCIELLEKHYPGVSEKIEVVDLATPKTTERFTGVWKGAYEGFVPAVGNLGTHLPMELDGLDNFSMIGQWVMPGGGLPPSAQSGRWAIQKLAKKDKKKFMH